MDDEEDDDPDDPPPLSLDRVLPPLSLDRVLALAPSALPPMLLLRLDPEPLPTVLPSPRTTGAMPLSRLAVPSPRLEAPSLPRDVLPALPMADVEGDAGVPMPSAPPPARAFVEGPRTTSAGCEGSGAPARAVASGVR